jgi:3-phosphoshikimate 1-carboxyvinyltransferase
LAVKETDRINAVKQGLKRMGIKVKIFPDLLIIYGGFPKKAVIESLGDHRTAMSFAIAGAKIPGIIIKDPSVVGKTFPTFWEKIRQIGMISK